MIESKTRAKRGPKPKPAALKLRNEIRIYVSDFIYRQLDVDSRETGKSVSDIVRAMLDTKFNLLGINYEDLEPLVNHYYDWVEQALTEEVRALIDFEGEDAVFELLGAEVDRCFELRMPLAQIIAVCRKLLTDRTVAGA